ncbi:MAG: hypothetical protein EZS28_044084, partial [Streblomastix strix]
MPGQNHQAFQQPAHNIPNAPNQPAYIPQFVGNPHAGVLPNTNGNLNPNAPDAPVQLTQQQLQNIFTVQQNQAPQQGMMPGQNHQAPNNNLPHNSNASQRPAPANHPPIFFTHNNGFIPNTNIRVPPPMQVPAGNQMQNNPAPNQPVAGNAGFFSQPVNDDDVLDDHNSRGDNYQPVYPRNQPRQQTVVEEDSFQAVSAIPNTTPFTPLTAQNQIQVFPDNTESFQEVYPQPAYQNPFNTHPNWQTRVREITRCTREGIAMRPRNSFFMYTDDDQHIYAIRVNGDVVCANDAEIQKGQQSIDIHNEDIYGEDPSYKDSGWAVMSCDENSTLKTGCSKTTQLTHITDPILEDKHQAVAANPEAPSCWSLYWKWGVVAFVGITGLILGYRHREELSSAYHNARLNYMKNADFRFFPDETNPQNKPPANNLP